MINVKFDARRLKRRFEEVEQAVVEAVGVAFEEGYSALISETPEDTGFLRASWYKTVGGSPGDGHPNPPDAAAKAKLKYPHGRYGPFVSGYEQAAAGAGAADYNVGQQVGRSVNIAVAKVTWRNTAPYAERLDSGNMPGKGALSAGWIARATDQAQDAIRTSLKSANFKIYTR
jgi:hypothetical protein